MVDIERRLENALRRRRREGTYRKLPYDTIEKSDSLSSEISKTTMTTTVDFSTNDYLGVARCPRQLAAVTRAFERSTTFDTDVDGAPRELDPRPLLGATGSRLLSGDSESCHRLERRLARVHGRERALLFNSGYDANLSVLSCVPSEDDVVIMDELCHNSLVMGARMGRGRGVRVETFRHNDAEDLRRILRRASTNLSAASRTTTTTTKKMGTGHAFVVVESVYSMDGDVAPLAAVCDAAFRHGASVIVDEAHGFGVYGVTNLRDLAMNDDDDDSTRRSPSPHRQIGRAHV